MRTDSTGPAKRSESHSAIVEDKETREKLTGAFRGFFALRNSVKGFKSAWKEESSFRQEVVVFILLAPLTVVLDLSAIERLLLATTLLLVLLVELVNSSIEAVIDRISLERHELSARAKDCGSAAVTLSIVICVLTWGTLCVPVIIRWLHS